MTEPAHNHAPSYLMEFIVGVLAPLLMAGSITDLHLARLAAAEAIDAYQTSGSGQLMTISQIVAFALTALDNLRLSMPGDLSLSMKLKLRSNANALNRTARANTHLLEHTCPATESPKPALAEPTDNPVPAKSETIPLAPQTPEATPSATRQQHTQGWAAALQAQAVRLRATSADVPAAQQKANQLWVDVLTDVASELRQGKPPGMTKSALMRTTLMSRSSVLPSHRANPAGR